MRSQPTSFRAGTSRLSAMYAALAQPVPAKVGVNARHAHQLAVGMNLPGRSGVAALCVTAELLSCTLLAFL